MNGWQVAEVLALQKIPRYIESAVELIEGKRLSALGCDDNIDIQNQIQDVRGER